MDRRNLLIGLGGLVAGGGALIGTGAFDTVEAERSVSVETAGDADAFLALSEAEDYDNGAYYFEEDGLAGIDLSGDNYDIEGGGAGINLQATTKIFNIVEVENQGTQPVAVWTPEEGIEGDGSFSTFAPHATDLPDRLDTSEIEGFSWTLYDEVNLKDDEPFADDSRYITLEPGESFNLGLWIVPEDDTEVDEFDITITIEANSEMADVPQ